MTVRIPLSAPDITQVEIDAVTAVLHSPQLSLGPELGTFEKELAAYCGVADAVAVSSGTAGLHLALVTLGIGPGDEVIVPSFAFIAVANVVLQVGAVAVFAEIDVASLNLDPAAVERAITARTRAVIAVHTFGVPADMHSLNALAQRHGLVVIEDACEALGATIGGAAAQATLRRVGSFGDLAVLGFYPNKQMTTGEGGAVLVRDAARAARLRSLRNQGRVPGGDWLDHAEPGFNYRLPEMACALGRVQLRRLDGMLAARAQAARRYDTLLRAMNRAINPEGLELPPLEWPNASVSWFVYVVRLPLGVDRKGVQTALAEQGIATGRYFAPIHQQRAWAASAGPPAALALTESIAQRTLALPFFNRITSAQQEQVALALSACLQAG